MQKRSRCSLSSFCAGLKYEPVVTCGEPMGDTSRLPHQFGDATAAGAPLSSNNQKSAELAPVNHTGTSTITHVDPQLGTQGG